MPARAAPFLLSECDVIRFGFASYLSVSEIVAELNAMDCNEDRKRNNYQVHRFIKEMRLTRPRQGTKEIAQKGHRTRTSASQFILHREDMRFKKAMLAARDTEKFVIGVFKDRRPLMVHSIVPEPIHSGCSSAAALCAEVGGKGIEFTEGV